jgi:excisionase family DNA binding protein
VKSKRRRGVNDISTIPQLLTIDQLAERLGITVRHVRRLVAERRVPYLKVGRLVRFDPSEIAKWLRDSAQPATDGKRLHRLTQRGTTLRPASPAR